MQPTEHMNPAEDELIAHIRDSLSGHEEAYAPGAWEKFNEKERKKPAVWLWSFSSAAAIFVLCTMIFLRNGEKVPGSGYRNESPVSELKVQDGYKSANSGSQLISNDSVVVGQQKIRKKNTITAHYENVSPIEGPGLVAAAHLDGTGIKADPDLSVELPVVTMSSSNGTQNRKVDTKPDHNKMSIEDFLAKESERNALTQGVEKKRTDKWEVGLMVAPSMGNDKKLNMGYGLSMAYALSDKVAVGSGLAYNEMGASRDNTSLVSAAPNAPSMMALAASSKQLQSVQTRIRGVDVPLEFRYKFSPKLYANAGVSVFAVFKREQQNTFLQSSVESASAAGLLNEDKDAFRQVLVNRVVSEDAPKDEVRNEPYLRFYNFSVGFKQKVSKKSAIAVEPFLKVPMRQGVNENLNLMGTGVKLRFDF